MTHREARAQISGSRVSRRYGTKSRLGLKNIKEGKKLRPRVQVAILIRKGV